jgi:hypothetical protein
VPAQGFEPWTIGLKVGLSDVRDVPPDQSKTHSVFEIAQRLVSPFRRVSQKSVLVAALMAVRASYSFEGFKSESWWVGPLANEGR